MSLSRNLVDLYVLASGVTKVGTNVLASQTSAVCHHVKTSSILNPTTFTREQPLQHHTTATAAEAPIEVPFPDFVEQKVDATKPDVVEEIKQANAAPVSSNKETAFKVPETATQEKIRPATVPTRETTTATTDKASTISEQTIEIPKVVTVEETPNAAIKIETPYTDNLFKEAATIGEKKRELKESRIPTSRFGRLWNYGTLGMGMGMGAINESFRRATGLSQDSSGKFLIFA